jgi:hypothetical protein
VNEQGRTKTLRFLERDVIVRRRRADVLEDAPLCHAWLMGDLDEHDRVEGEKRSVGTERGKRQRGGEERMVDAMS